MLIILALIVLPLIGTGLTAWRHSNSVNQRVTLLVGIAHLVASLYCLISRQNPFPAGWWLAVDPLASFFLAILSHTFLLVTLYSPGFLKQMVGPEYGQSKRLF